MAFSSGQKERWLELLRRDHPEEESFALGMAAAFCECVAAECKRLAFSPPLRPESAARLWGRMEAVALLHSLRCYLDEGRDLPLQQRQCWYVFYKFPEDLEAYHLLRQAGENPLVALQPFAGLLGYGTAHVPPGGAPALAEERPAVDVFGALFHGF